MRNLNPHTMFVALAEHHRPRYRFAGRTPAQFRRWQAQARPAVMACLGDFPARVPPNPALVAEWTERGLRMQRWIIDVQEHLSATLLVNYPADLKPGERRPAILCWHGHGRFGKDPVMGDRPAPALEHAISRMN